MNLHKKCSVISVENGLCHWLLVGSTFIYRANLIRYLRCVTRDLRLRRLVLRDVAAARQQRRRLLTPHRDSHHELTHRIAFEKTYLRQHDASADAQSTSTPDHEVATDDTPERNKKKNVRIMLGELVFL